MSLEISRLMDALSRMEAMSANMEVMSASMDILEPSKKPSKTLDSSPFEMIKWRVITLGHADRVIRYLY